MDSRKRKKNARRKREVADEIMEMVHGGTTIVDWLQIRSRSNRIQRRHEDWHSHRQRVVRCAGLAEMAIRRLERRRYPREPYGERRFAWVSLYYNPQYRRYNFIAFLFATFYKSIIKILHFFINNHLFDFYWNIFTIGIKLQFVFI